MFASDYDRKGMTISYTFSITVHVLILLLFLMYQNRQKRMLADYTLTEITMIETMPDEQKPVELQKPKNMMDILKQVIPIKSKASLEVSKPKALELEKPKMALDKPKALDMSSTKLDKLNPAMKAIDLENEIGQKKISPAMAKAQLDLQKSQQLAAAPSKIDLSKTTSKPSSFLPQARPGAISTQRKAPALTQGKFQFDKPTPAPAAPKADENVVIQKKSALLISGAIAGRPILQTRKPPYPRWAQEQAIEAAVTIFFAVSPDGNVKDNAYVERTSGYAELDQLALEALMQFKFAPIDTSEDQSGYATFRYMLER